MEEILTASELRAETNRKNARLSTGPRTPAGKARSSLNALRHGITGQISIMTEEDRAAHDRFCQELIDGFKPETPLEVQLASTIAEDFWRLQRIRAVENDILALGCFSDAAAIEVDHSEIHNSLTRARTFLEHSKDFERLTLYEQRINRSIEKNRRQLAEIQSDRESRRRQALEEACLLRESTAAQEQPNGDKLVDRTNQATGASEPASPRTPSGAEGVLCAASNGGGFVFSSEEIERAGDRRSRLVLAQFMRTRAEISLKARAADAAHSKATAHS